MNLKDIVPKYSEHAIFVGKTKSGKSFLVKKLIPLSEYKDIVIIDPKNEIHSPNALRVGRLEDIPEKYRGLIIYCPDNEFDNVNEYEKLLRWIYKRGNTLVYIDELYAISDNGYTYPPTLKALYTRGRGLGISVWGCSQRPSGCPLYCVTETASQYVFTLKLLEDRKRLAGVMGEQVLHQNKMHNFWYSHDELESPILLRYDNGVLVNGTK